MKKIVTILGARPQFIKAATISRLLTVNNSLNEIIIHTDQHYDYNMSQIFFSELEIPKPTYNLAIGSASHGQQTGAMIIEIEKVLVDESPDLVLVYGDTNSTLAGALAAVKLHIPVAHVEAGLRSYNKHMPEEINRLLTDHMSAILFAPTHNALQILHQENHCKDDIYFVGDVMFDACLHYEEKTKGKSLIDNIKSKQYALATIHRAENTNNLQNITIIVNCLIELSRTLMVILPLHPRTKKSLQEYGLYKQLAAHVNIIQPVSYLEMLSLEKNAQLIITDSGGVQKEAYFYQVPCITLRSETEWVELLEIGANCLLPPSSVDNFLAAVDNMQNSVIDNKLKPYGNGDAANQIIKILAQRIA